MHYFNDRAVSIVIILARVARLWSISYGLWAMSILLGCTLSEIEAETEMSLARRTWMRKE